MSRTNRMALDAIQADLDRMAAELAAAIATKQAAELAAAETAARTESITALVSTAGVAAAGITLTAERVPARRLNRNQLILAAAQGSLDSLAADIQAAIETGAPITPADTEPIYVPPTPEPTPRRTGLAGIRQALRAGWAYSGAYTETYAAEMASSR